MKRIQYHQYGGPEVMRLEDFRPARPGRGEVLVQVRAAAANPLDWKVRNGEMRLITGRTFPRGLGYDFAGVVAAVGERVSRLRVGDEVLGGAAMKASGAFAEMVVAAEKGLVKKPAGLSFEQAAAIPMVGVTALQALMENGKMQPGAAVFVHGCLGGVGRTAVQLAAVRGASVVAGSCRTSSMGDARALGVDPVVEFDSVPSSLNKRFDIVFDTVGSLPPATARMLLNRGGRVIDIVPSPMKFLRSMVPRSHYRVQFTQPSLSDLEEIADACAQGALRIPVAQTVPLAEAISALIRLECHHTPKGGKLIITMNGQ
ncbi:NADP-dependent oxidoreductase [Mycobacterium sp. HNNTM2301]|uniref:NADP-dependent oxidoreductase n=1 Tax=Mycobacterium hainanense TaxID=3289775 RepID=UPI0035A62B84